MGLFEEVRVSEIGKNLKSRIALRVSRRVIEKNPIVTNRGSKHKITLSFNMSYTSKLPPTLLGDQLLLVV